LFGGGTAADLVSRDRPKHHMGGMIPFSMRGPHFSDYATEDVRFKQRL